MLSEQHLTEINCETVRDLRNRGLHYEADAMIKEHQRQFKKGMQRFRRACRNKYTKKRTFKLVREGVCMTCARRPINYNRSKNRCNECLDRSNKQGKDNKRKHVELVRRRTEASER